MTDRFYWFCPKCGSECETEYRTASELFGRNHRCTDGTRLPVAVTKVTPRAKRRPHLRVVRLAGQRVAR